MTRMRARTFSRMVPVDGDAVAHGQDELAGDGLQRVVAQYFDGAVVDFEGVVEGDFVFRQLELLAAAAGWC